MYEISLTEFDLPSIMNSGQTFRIRPLGKEGAGRIAADFSGEAYLPGEAYFPGEAYLVAAGARAVLVLPQEAAGNAERKRFLFSCREEEFNRFWRGYFDLDTDYGSILRSIDPQDSYLQAAGRYGRGIRILRQDLWETIISFLISQNNNIVRIRRSVEALCARFGERTACGGSAPAFPVYSFPSPEALCSEGLSGLAGLGLGYRDKYLLRMAQFCSVAEGKQWLERLKACSYQEAMAMLLKQYGIGQKVADCICLFALHHVDAFPIDTHIRQILSAHYPSGFPLDRYKGCAGILQQYLFYYKQSKASEG